MRERRQRNAHGRPASGTRTVFRRGKRARTDRDSKTTRGARRI